MFSDFEDTKKQGNKDGDDGKETEEAEGFAHDGKNGVVDGFGEIAGSLNRITDTDAKETANADGEHGVIDMVSRVGTFPAGQSSEPGVNPFHPVARKGDRSDRTD